MRNEKPLTAPFTSCPQHLLHAHNTYRQRSGIYFPIFSIWNNDAYPHQTANDVQMGAVMRVTEVIHVTKVG
jgi:hypothetical protein